MGGNKPDFSSKHFSSSKHFPSSKQGNNSDFSSKHFPSSKQGNKPDFSSKHFSSSKPDLVSRSSSKQGNKPECVPGPAHVDHVARSTVWQQVRGLQLSIVAVHDYYTITCGNSTAEARHCMHQLPTIYQ